MKMHNLHLLIFGSTEEEIRANAAKALDDAFRNHKAMGDSANCIGDEYEYEFRKEKYMADICEAYIGQVNLSRQPLEVLEALSKAVRNELETRADRCIEPGNMNSLVESEIDLINSGKRIDAIWSYRSRNNCSVRFAKKVVDKYKEDKG